MAGWTQAEYRAWLTAAEYAYFSAMRSDLDPDAFDHLGGVFSMAAMDRRRHYRWWNLEGARRQATRDAWARHRAAIEKRMASMSPDRAVAEYLVATTGTWPQSTDQLLQANRRTTSSGRGDPSGPQWEFDLLVQRGAIRKALKTQPGVVAGIATLAHQAVSSDKSWQESLRWGMDAEALTKPIVDAASARGIAASARYSAPVDTRASVTVQQPTSERPRVDTRSTQQRLDSLAERSTAPGRIRDGQRGASNPIGQRPGPAQTRPPQTAPKPPSSPPTSTSGRGAAPARVAPATRSVLGPQEQAILAEKLRNDQGAIRAVERFFARFPKLSRDRDTVERIGGHFRVTRGLVTDQGDLRTFKENREVSGELKAIIQLLRNDLVTEVRVIKPINLKGFVNADLLIAVKGHASSIKVEITTITGAARSERTKPRTPGSGGKDPSVDRPTTTRKIIAAVRRKLNSGQAEDGIVVVEVPYGTKALLTHEARAKINQMWKEHRAKGGRVREVWIVLPDLATARFLSGQGLGLADRLP